MKLTAENYFSPEAKLEYFSVSQYKNFVGTYGMKGCEAAAMAEIRGEWREEMTIPLLVGSYVDAHFEGTLGVFKAQNPDIFTKNGDLKAPYLQANDIIARIDRSEYFTKCMSGEKQVIMTGEMFGVKWKIKVDSLHRDACIVDLKIMKAIRDTFWVRDLGRISFVEYWGYNVQAAVYQEIVRQNIGKKLPILIAAASKEKVTDIQVVGFDQPYIDDTMSLIVPNINRINDLKLGRATPDRCEECDWCKQTKVITGPIHFSELINKL